MNQIASRANSLGYVDELEYRRCADEVMKLCGEIQKEHAKNDNEQNENLKDDRNLF